MLSRPIINCIRRKCTNGKPHKEVVYKSSLSAYVHGTSATPLLFETIGERFRSQVEKHPDKTLYVFDHQNIRKTYEEAYLDARKLACALLELGLKQGDRVGIWGPNYYEWVTCQMATAIAGLIQVNVNPSYQSEELRYALGKVEVKALLMPKSYRKSDYYAKLREIIPSMSNHKEGLGTIKDRQLPELDHIIMFGEEQRVRGAWKYEELVAGVGSTSESRLETMADHIRVDDPVNIQYTSGTTGFPKAATLTHHSLLNNSYFQGIRSRYHEGDHIICIPNPLYHTFGCAMGVLNALVHGQTTVFPDAGFNPYKTLEVVDKEQCTSLYGTPTMFIDVLRNLPDATKNGVSVKSLHGGYICGAPCPITLCERIVNELNMKDLLILYGSTELSPIVTASRLEDPPEKRLHNVGYALDHVELIVIDENGVRVRRGIQGELLARGYNVMRGYYNDIERTKKDLTADRWYHTGDTAMMLEDGAICIVGRSKDMIIRGGENIYPAEIEQFLFKMDGIADAQVIGVPDERMGEAVCAWIRLREGETKITPEAIKEYCKGKIAHFKIPQYILIKKEHEFPMTATGKVKKIDIKHISMRELGLEQVQSHFNVTTKQ